MYTIGQVAGMTGLSVSTLRYYDKEGLLPHLTRSSGIRQFSDRDIETLRMVECLKKTGMEIRDIKQFTLWCTQGSATYPQRHALLLEQKERLEGEISRMEKALAMLRFKCWYYEKAQQDGNEDGIRVLLPDRLPPEIQVAYDLAHKDERQWN